jgi:hypothetical protein
MLSNGMNPHEEPKTNPDMFIEPNQPQPDSDTSLGTKGLIAPKDLFSKEGAVFFCFALQISISLYVSWL